MAKDSIARNKSQFGATVNASTSASTPSSKKDFRLDDAAERATAQDGFTLQDLFRVTELVDSRAYKSINAREDTGTPLHEYLRKRTLTTTMHTLPS